MTLTLSCPKSVTSQNGSMSSMHESMHINTVHGCMSSSGHVITASDLHHQLATTAMEAGVVAVFVVEGPSSLF